MNQWMTTPPLRNTTKLSRCHPADRAEIVAILEQLEVEARAWLNGCSIELGESVADAQAPPMVALTATPGIMIGN